MLNEKAKEHLESQQYRVVGSHSAVKVCHWTKSMLKGDGGCYKLTFYGIMSHQCMQATPSISCANRCVFCWRGYKAPVSKTWKWDVDDPEMIVEKSIEAHHKLLTGYGGHERVNSGMYEQSKSAKHVALSLTGEPITYPKINEMLKVYNKKGVSTFLVTNAQYPEQIKNLEPVTQLYLSIDAPTKELLKEVDNPLFEDYWERFIGSIEAARDKKQRTTARLTVIKGLNDVLPEKYADWLKLGNFDFVEIKGYVFVGASRQRLSIDNMPMHEEVVAFAREVEKHLPGYEMMSEHIPSRVVLLAKKDRFFKDGAWHTWIDFEKWHELMNTLPDDARNNVTVEDYMTRTRARTGISGKGTADYVSPMQKKRMRKEHAEIEN
ncbi:MAG: 4-demethylwyosine synthase TYW1 [Candidatus Woesearchaeota archaeon]